MLQKRLYFTGLFLFFTTFLPFRIILSQTEVKSISGHKYGLFGGKWYTLNNDEKGYLLDPEHLIVRLKDKSKIEVFDFTKFTLPHLKTRGGKIGENYYTLTVPKGLNVFDVAQKLEKTEMFDYIMSNFFVPVDDTPNDTYYSSQWNLSKDKTNLAWELTKGSPNVIVGVIDVGVEHSHEDLIGNRWSGIGYDFISGDNDPNPNDGARHGTAVAGIISAVTNNSTDVAGFSGGWNGTGGVRLMSLRAGFIADGIDQIDIAAAGEAVTWAANNGVSVLNMSFGGSTEDSSMLALHSAITDALSDHGVVCVVAAGNYYNNLPKYKTVFYPAVYSDVIAVGAISESETRKAMNDGTDEIWWGSCYGPELDIVACPYPKVHPPRSKF